METELERSARGAAPRPIRSAARAEIRRRFLAGTLEPSGRPGLEDPAAGRPGAGRPGARRLRLVAGALAAAAAILVVALTLPRVPHWRVHAVDGEGPVLVDGAALERLDPARLGGLFERAAPFETGRRGITLTYGDDLVLRLRPGTRVAHEASADGPIRLRLEEGELYVKTRPGYDGREVVVRTPDLEARLAGTVLGVMASSEGSCVCVAEGEVAVVPRENGEVLAVSPGSSRQVWRDGRPSTVASLRGERPGDLRDHELDLIAFAERERPLGF